MHDFTVLVPEGAYAASVAATLDMLAAAAALAPGLGMAAPTWQVRTLAAGPTRLTNGLTITARALPAKARPDRSIWVVPGLATDSPARVDARLQAPDALHAIKALRVQAQSGGTVAAACSAVFLLQAAGLLPGRRATTTWWLATHLQQREPRCAVDANRMVIADGPIWTAGAAFAQTDLMLQLLRTRCGANLADAVARTLLIDGREAQAPFMVPALLANGDRFVAQLSLQIEAMLPDAPGVARLAAQLGMSERTLARRVLAATGRSTSELIQSVRLNRARRLLEASRMSVAEVAAQVGYQDATALRRLMRKLFGVTPRQLRTPNR